jgi:putative ABC transport system permease protein
LTVFFLPLGVACLHIAVAFRIITKLLSALMLKNVRLYAACTLATIGVFALVYAVIYAITSREYYKIVRRV